MKLKNTFLFALIVSAFSFGFASCNSTETTDTTSADTSSTSMMKDSMLMAQATIEATYKDTALQGNASFHQKDGKVEMELTITVPSRANKSVAVHLHEHGDCGDAGMGAHGHWNPTNQEHGKWGTEPFHRGDIGNVELDAEGRGTLKMSTDLWTIGGDSTTNILNRAVIVHSGVDDYKTQPTGNAGGRLGCGVIQKN